MITTIEVICYKSKVLKNNEHPLMLRVTKDKKRKYLSLGISINPIYWDFNKNKPKRNCPNKEHILQVVSEKKKTFSDQIMELKAMDRDFTPTSLIEK